MGKDLYTFFNIEKAEKASVSLFLIQSVFLGIFYGAFDVGAHALFLSVYPASMIPKAYVLSGIVGIILTTIYARMQSRYKFSTLAVINLVFISLSTAFLRVLFQYTESTWLIFLIFIMMGPLNIIALLGFWGAVGRIFTLRQGKRLFGLIDSGQIFGAILSTFAIPILITVGFEQKNLLFLSSVSIGCALLVQIIISVKYNLNQQVTKAARKQKRLPELLKNKYIRNMAVFVVMSMLTAFFIQYSFLSVTKDNYPDNNDLTEFLGAFTGSLLLFTFLFKTFVYSKLMKAYGLKISITISSFLLGIFTAIAVLIGSLSGYTSASSSFIFFFLIISLSRLFSKALKDGVEVPSFKILYQSLKAEIRHDVQAYIDGTINEIAALSAGLLLAALSLFEFFKLIHFSYSLMLILIIWFIVARRLYAEYKISLQKSLAEYKKKKVETENLSDFLHNNINNKAVNQDKLLTGLEYDFCLHPLKFETKIESLINNNNIEIKNFVMDKISEFKILDYSKQLQANKTGQTDLITKYNLKIEKSPGVKKLIELSKSKSTEERILATYLIGKFYNPELFLYLKSLIRDLQTPVKIAAIKAATKTNDKDFCPLILDYIDTKELINYVYDSLLTFGEAALESIDQVFYKTGTNHRALLRIVKLIGQIGGDKAKTLLIKKLGHPNEEVLNYVLISLNEIGFKASEQELNFIHQILEKHIGVIAWNIAAKTTLDETDGYETLKQAIHNEITANYDLLYLMLSLAYDSKSIMHVKENIESATNEGISYALELLDLFIHEEIKPKLFPIVEDISPIEKIRQLQNFYPVEKLAINELLISIINRDINNINIWTKACAISAYANIEDKEVPDDLVAQLFNPYEILRESSALVIKNLNSQKLENIEKRLKVINEEKVTNTIQTVNNNDKYFLIDKTKYLKSVEYFNNIDGRYIYEIAKNVNYFKILDNEINNIVLSDLKNKIIFIKGNSVKIKIDDEKEIELLNREMYDMNTILKGAKDKISFAGDEESAVFYIDKQELIYNIFDFYKIEKAVIDWLNTTEEYKVVN